MKEAVRYENSRGRHNSALAIEGFTIVKVIDMYIDSCGTDPRGPGALLRVVVVVLYAHSMIKERMICSGERWTDG